MKGWVGPRAGLDAVVKRKIPSLYRIRTPVTVLPLDQVLSQFSCP